MWAGSVRETRITWGTCCPETLLTARAHGWLFVVADGVGGHEKGEVASQTAVESLVGFSQPPARMSRFPSLIRRLVQAANAACIRDRVDGGTSGAGMATTIVACALRYDRAVVAHVGDSRCYLIRGER